MQDIPVIEGGQQNPQLTCGQVQLILHQRRRRRQVAAIDIVDEYGGGHQGKTSRAGDRESGTGPAPLGACCMGIL